jgi:acyl carrier protein
MPASFVVAQCPQCRRRARTKIATSIIEALTLDIGVDAFDPEAPLYGDRFGLDSIDMLEIALVISQRYGFQIRSDDVENEHVFASLRSLAAHVAQHRTR